MLMIINKVIKAILIASIVIVTGCGGEERQAKYLERAQSYFDTENYEKARIEVKNVLQINPKNAPARYLLGELEERGKNWRAAYANYQSVIELDPTFVDAHVKLANFYVLAKDLDKAEQSATKALELEPSDANALSALANIYAQQGKTEDAITKAQEALASEQGNVSAIAVLTRVYQEKDPDLALKIIGDGLAAQSESEILQLLKLQILKQQKKYNEVEEIFEVLIKEYPDKLLYPYQYINFYLSIDNEDMDGETKKAKARALLDRFISEKPDNFDVKRWMVEFLIKNESVQEGLAKLESFYQAEPDNFKLLDSLTTLYIQLKDYDKVEQVVQPFIEKDPVSSESIAARVKLLRAVLAKNDHERADILLEEILSLDSQNSDALGIRAGIKLADADVKGAIADLRTVIKNEPESVPALIMLGDAYMRDNSPELALDHYQRLLSIDSNNYKGLVGSANILMKKGDVEQALPLLEAAINSKPGDLEVSRLLTDIYSRQQRWDDAIAVASQLLNDEKTATLGYYLQGRTYLRQKEFKSAITALEKSLDIEPRIVEALSALTSAYAAVDQNDKALEYLKNHLKKNPDHYHAKELLARIYASVNQLSQSEQILKALIDEQPERESAYRLLTRIYSSQKKLDQIEALYKEGLKKKPDNSALRLMLTEFYQAVERYQEAVEGYEILLEAYPNSLLVKNNLASILIDHFKTEENIKRAADLATDLASSESPAFLDTAGWVQYQLGNIPQALSLLQAAVSKGGNSAVFHYHLGMAYYKSDMAAQAKEQLSLALADDKANFPGKEEAEKVLSTL